MSLLNYKKSQSRAVVRGRMLIAWFSDATPPVLWRWPAGESAASLGIRQQDGKVELVKQEALSEPTVVAVFTSVERAERALDKLSRALVGQQSFFGKLLRYLLIFFGILFLLFALREIYNAATGSAPAKNQAAQSTSQRNTSVPASELGSVQPPPGFPGVPARPVTPPAGAPVDVDSFYH